jgi:hypothetical protein
MLPVLPDRGLQLFANLQSVQEDADRDEFEVHIVRFLYRTFVSRIVTNGSC